MNTRSRKQKATETAVVEDKPAPAPSTTSNGVSQKKADDKNTTPERHENIFLFWPNLVGEFTPFNACGGALQVGC
jgi:hypothetical protein